MSNLLRNNLPDLYLSTALPFIEKVIQEEFEEYPKVYEQVFNVGDMSNGIAQHTQVSSLSAAGIVGEAEEIPQSRIRQGYSKTYIAQKYGIMLATSQEAIDDEKYSVIAANPRRLARAMVSAQEISAAAVLNGGFSDTGPDGVSLFNTAHPSLVPGALNSSNRLAVAADLSITSLKDLITVYMKQLDTAGNRIMIKPTKLVVPQELSYLAYELTNSVMLPEGNQNNVNSVGPQGMLMLAPVTWQYLVDADAFYLVGDKSDHELHFMFAQRMEIATQEEFKTQVALTRCTARWVASYSDWRGICGSPGA
jgi:hypothetical protein